MLTGWHATDASDPQAAAQRLHRNAVTASTRLGFAMEAVAVISSFSAAIAAGVKRNVFIVTSAANGWTDGLFRFGRKSGVLRGGNTAAELKTGEISEESSRRAMAAQHLVNELRL